MRVRLGEVPTDDTEPRTDAPQTGDRGLPENEGEPDFGTEMAEAIVARRRREFEALSDLNDDVSWGD